MKKLVTLIISAICIILLNVSLVYAEGNASIVLEKEDQYFKTGESTEIKVLIKGLSEAENVVTVNATINYDTNVFDNISISKSNDWGELENVNNMINISTTDLETITSDSVICTIKLNTKQEVTVDSTNIRLENIQICDDDYNVTNLENANIQLLKYENQENLAGKDLPKAGISGAVMILIIAIVGVAAYIIRKKEKNVI